MNFDVLSQKIGQLPLGAGLEGLSKTLVDQWIGPIYIVIVAVVAITLLLKKEIRGLVAFLIVAIICGLLVYFGKDLFGSSGKLTGAAKKAAGDISYIQKNDFQWDLNKQLDFNK